MKYIKSFNRFSIRCSLWAVLMIFFLWACDEDKILLAIIRALGDTKGEAGIEELFDITPIFGNPIVDEARKSLQKKGITI